MSDSTSTDAEQGTSDSLSWVRGVNIGGWMVLERYITPYQFAITDCHLEGDFCWYPGQLSAPPLDDPAYKLCHLWQCHPVLQPHPMPNGPSDYPVDEHSLGMAFGRENREAATAWLNFHFEHFITFEDVKALKESGLTHVRVPLPHWILGDVRLDEGEYWIVGDRWKYFIRLCTWCRQVGLQVWPDVHTAPGSQNGFDNSGQNLPQATCTGWSSNPEHVQRTLQTIRAITKQIVVDGIQDVVTGFGLLNEPFKDCRRDVYEAYLNQGLDIVRGTLGPNTAVYASDLFATQSFNNGGWWLNPKRYNNTYLDSHYYHVFAEKPRSFSPRQHIAFVCQQEHRDAIACCYRDAPKRNKMPSTGVKRLIGEWSAATDTSPMDMVHVIMQEIKANGTAALLDRQLSPARQEFLRHFVEAQIVTYESADTGVSGGWFFWTAKVEGGAFAEWDYLRAFREGWMPPLPDQPHVPSQELYGTCYDIIFRTNDSMDIIHEFPDPATLTNNYDWPIDDDVVLSHGDSLLHTNDHYFGHGHGHMVVWIFYISAICMGILMWRCFTKKNRKNEYIEISGTEV